MMRRKWVVDVGEKKKTKKSRTDESDDGERQGKGTSVKMAGKWHWHLTGTDRTEQGGTCE